MKPEPEQTYIGNANRRGCLGSRHVEKGGSEEVVGVEEEREKPENRATPSREDPKWKNPMSLFFGLGNRGKSCPIAASP